MDTRTCWRTVWDAVRCYRSQLPGYAVLPQLPEEYHVEMWGNQTYCRVFSRVNGGFAKERNRFEGRRDTPDRATEQREPEEVMADWAPRLFPEPGEAGSWVAGFGLEPSLRRWVELGSRP